MLIPTPLKKYRKRHNRKPRPVYPPEPVVVTVVAVRIVTAEILDFEFSAPVTTNGDGGSEIVVFNTNMGDASPVGSEQQNATTVRFGFDPGVGIEAGDEWSIASVPGCLGLNGATMPVPQNGAVGV